MKRRSYPLNSMSQYLKVSELRILPENLIHVLHFERNGAFFGQVTVAVPFMDHVHLHIELPKPMDVAATLLTANDLSGKPLFVYDSEKQYLCNPTILTME